MAMSEMTDCAAREPIFEGCLYFMSAYLLMH